MRSIKFGLIVGLASLSLAAFGVPSILIVQSKFAVKDGAEVKGTVASFIGQEFDANGRLLPVIYSTSDPVVKVAMANGRIKELPDNPKPKDIFNIARRLGVDFIVIIETTKTGTNIKAKAMLYRDRREIWKDEQNMSVTTGESLDSEATAKSLARTLVIRMDADPFKLYPDRPKTVTPALQPGQAPSIAPVIVPATGASSDDQLKSNVDALVKADKGPNAILLMRDAVDAAPLDIERRIALVDLLQTTNPIAAAEEARRAAALMPEKLELRVLAARAWMKAGRPEEAQKDLNEAIARDPNGAPTRLLLGELSLEQLDPAKAIAHLDEVVKQKDSGYSRFLRAVCRGLLGGVDGMQADLAAADTLEPTRSPEEVTRRYAFAVDICDRVMSQDGGDIRSLITKIVVKPKDKDLHDQIDQTLRLLQARAALLAALNVPPASKQANELRLLAYKLMVQTLLDIQTYSNTADSDTLADARINLGEAIKQLAAAKSSSAR